jgi:hypothetical protein
MDEAQLLRDWLASFPARWTVQPFPPPETLRDAYREALFHEILAELDLLKELFGYEAVYVGIGCKAFPEAIPEP